MGEVITEELVKSSLARRGKRQEITSSSVNN